MIISIIVAIFFVKVCKKIYSWQSYLRKKNRWMFFKLKEIWSFNVSQSFIFKSAKFIELLKIDIFIKPFWNYFFSNKIAKCYKFARGLSSDISWLSFANVWINFFIIFIHYWRNTFLNHLLLFRLSEFVTGTDN